MLKRDLCNFFNIGLLAAALILISYSLSLVAQPRGAKKEVLPDKKSIDQKIKKEIAALEIHPNQIATTLEKIDGDILALTKKAEAYLLDLGMLSMQGEALSKHMQNFYDALQTVLQHVDSNLIPRVLKERRAIRTIPNVAQSSAQVSQENLNKLVETISNFPIKPMVQTLQQYFDVMRLLINNLGIVFKGAGKREEVLGAKGNALAVLATALDTIKSFEPLLAELGQWGGMSQQRIKEKITDRARDNAQELMRASTLTIESVKQATVSIEQSKQALKKLSEQVENIAIEAGKLANFDQYILEQLQAKKAYNGFQKFVRGSIDDQLKALKPSVKAIASFVGDELERIGNITTIRDIQRIINALNLEKLVAPALQELLRNIDSALGNLKRTGKAVSTIA